MNGALDFEQSTFQNIVVVVTDQGGLSFSKSFNISIIDKNDPPTVSEWLIETIEQTRLQFFTCPDVNSVKLILLVKSAVLRAIARAH